MNVAVLVSGRGSNMQSILDALVGDPTGKVTLVVSNKPDAPALERATNQGVSAVHIAASDEGGLLALLIERDIGLVVLAGYLRKIPSAVIQAFKGRILNIHPALLPAFGGPGMYGRRVHEAVLASGARLTGATVHVVDEQYDHGPIVAQWPVPVRPGDTAETLAARVLEIEHRLLPAATVAFCRCLASGARPPAALAAAANAFVLSDIPEVDVTRALIPA